MSRPYHHGDLRRTLLQAAWDLLDEGGVDAVTLRAVARRAGVSHAAPNHHFAGKGGLLAVMVVQGYDELTEELQNAWDTSMLAEGAQDPLLALIAAGRAYVGFARRRPHAFTILGRPELRSPREDISHGQVEAAAERCFMVLERGVVVCQEAGAIDAGPPQPWALLAWTGAHGLAVMLTEGLIDLGEDGPSEDQLTTMMLLALRHGLQSRR